jgi:hypothetical protein
MNDLFWSLWLIDYLGSLPSNLIGACFFLFLLLLITLFVNGIIYEYEKEKRITRKQMTYFGVGLLFLPFLFSAIPSKQTMYLMLGVKTTENVMQTEFGKKIEQLVNQELDKLIKK